MQQAHHKVPAKFMHLDMLNDQLYELIESQLQQQDYMSGSGDQTGQNRSSQVFSPKGNNRLPQGLDSPVKISQSRIGEVNNGQQRVPIGKKSS